MQAPKQLKSEEEKKVSPRGSLHLLALGAEGLKAWRQAKAENEQE